jgi:hypothetical protein
MSLEQLESYKWVLLFGHMVSAIEILIFKLSP